MFRIAHISDLHFGRLQPGLVRGLLADLTVLRPTLTVVSGDLTQRGRRREFAAARRFLDRIPGEWIAVPGNHDLPTINLLERVVKPFARYRRFISPDLCPVWQNREAIVIGVNTARPFSRHGNWAHGRISRRQVRYVAKTVAGARDGQIKIVIAHHPFVAPKADPDRRLVGGLRRALGSFARCGVDVILSGHFHVSYADQVRHLGGPGKRGVYAVQASTATSSRLRGETNSYNLLEISGGRIGLGRRIWSQGRFTYGGSRQLR